MASSRRFALCTDKTLALRRRRICYPVVSVGDTVELAGVPVRPGKAVRRGKVFGDDVEFEIHAFDETNTVIQNGTHRAD